MYLFNFKTKINRSVTSFDKSLFSFFDEIILNFRGKKLVFQLQLLLQLFHFRSHSFKFDLEKRKVRIFGEICLNSDVTSRTQIVRKNNSNIFSTFFDHLGFDNCFRVRIEGARSQLFETFRFSKNF